MRLPRHPNLVPFDRVVTDELEGRVVGFTNNDISGGSLEENRSRVFRLKWLQQLTNLADDLNLCFGISHEDIAPRNLVINDSTDCMMLFDFNFAARINCSSRLEDEGYVEERNDVKWVELTMYEIITRDDSLRRVPHEDQHEDNLPRDWVKHVHVQLGHAFADYQLLLQDWKVRRLSKDTHDGLGNKLPEIINWTARPKPPKTTWNVLDSNFNPLALVVD
ncbi:Protein kinase-like domain protein [Metarhizium guizhouense ARSEF 977]|uniref:Protein kinase-like domain protein n=1 Tax=Metarhizium guizhouense (strain ARSEF 977) TaxID=1276136 RepID=A0A0B4H3M4_METGA|nr:Protein kinase-like domain protein [Metarhizium guizhouense ARSEF 977]